MLYVYDFVDYYGEENLQGLKPFGFEGVYIANTDNIVVEGENPRITPLHEFIHNGCFDCSDVLELDIMLLDKKLEIPKARAIELLSDDLKVDGDYEYNDRIFNAEDPAEEVEKIIRELTSVIVGMVIDNLNDEYKRIQENNFEWV